MAHWSLLHAERQPFGKGYSLRLTRRSLFAGTASLAATALAPAAQALPTHDEPELTALGAKFEQALAAYEAARRHFNACERCYLSEGPDPPPMLTEAGPLGHLLRIKGSWWSARELRWLLKDDEERASWPAARDAHVAALAYEARDRRFRRRIGFRAAERAHEDAIDTLHELGNLILATPAQSRAGLAVQGRVVKAWGKPEWWSRQASRADACERFAARIIDSVIAATPPP
jgi:hypothetical protein